jgi:type II secretory pathway component GspD/PulD (secretin)
MKRLFPLLGLALLLSWAVHANSITTIQLMNRPAEEVIPIIKPMLGAGDVITGKGFKLFLRSSAQTLEEVRDMIEALDVAARTLRISVRQGSEQSLEAMLVSGNIQIENDNVSVNVGTRESDAAGNIDYSNGNVSGGISASSTRLSQQNGPVHQLRVAEGTEGFIQTGQQIPYFTGAGWYRPATATVEYKDVTTGFYVLPRIRGENVTLQVSPFKNSLSKAHDGSINTQQANTTISGPIGEWLEVGGTTEQFKHSQSGILSRSSAEGSSEEKIWIKADLIR